MKKFLLLFSVFLIVFLFSCNKEDVKNDIIHQEKSKVETSNLREIASYHSKGLDYIYNELLKKESQTRSFNRDWNSEFSKIYISDLCVKFIKNVSNVNISSNSVTRSLSISKTDNNNQELSSDAQRILEEYFSYLMSYKNRQDIEIYIQNITKNNTFNTLEEKERNLLVFMMYIGVDSASYWSNSDNWEKWNCLKNGKKYNKTRGMAGPPASYWMTSEQANNPLFQKIVRNDVYGCLTSLVTGFSPWGWCSGGILGSVGSVLI